MEQDLGRLVDDVKKYLNLLELKLSMEATAAVIGYLEVSETSQNFLLFQMTSILIFGKFLEFSYFFQAMWR